VLAPFLFRMLLRLTVAAVTAAGGLVTLSPAVVAAPACPEPQAGVVRIAPGTGKTVALTFDDGPGPFTPDILAVLGSRGVRATFFDTGAHGSRYRTLTRTTAAEGHLVADHTWDHAYPADVPGGWSKAYLSDQFARTNTLQESLTGRPTCFFRPPGGFSSPDMLPTARAYRMSTVLWSVDSQDWRQPGRTTTAATKAIVDNALAGLSQAHPVVLLHAAKASHEPEQQVSSYRGNTVAALGRIIDAYRAAGYTFVDLAGGTGLAAAAPVTAPGGTSP
jgi:peptidoglycan/xylan/chitin deacetylase (PgdA/CDA1 family)